MKKTILILLICAFAGEVIAQTQVQWDTAYGGQLQMTSVADATIPDSSTAIVWTQWSFNSTFIPAFNELPDTLVNLSSMDSTFNITHVVDSMAPGWYWIRVINYNLTDSTSDTTIALFIQVTPVFVAPTISLALPIATTSGAVTSCTYNAGFTTALVKVYLSPGDTNFATPYLIDTFTVSGSGTQNYTFTGFPSQYYASTKFVIQNSVSADTSEKRWFQVLASGNPWISMMDSASATPVTVTPSFTAVTNGNNSTVTIYRFNSSVGPAMDSVTVTLPASNGSVPISVVFSGLTPNTVYYFGGCITGNSITYCNNRLPFATTVAPVYLSFNIDTAFTFSSNTEKFSVRCTSMVNANAQLLITPLASPNWSIPIHATPLVAFSQGVTIHTIDVTNPLSSGQSLIVGTWYQAKAQGFNLNGETAESGVYTFQFQPLTTEVEIPFDPIQVSIFWKNGNIISNQSGLIEIYSITGARVKADAVNEGEEFMVNNLASGLYIYRFTNKIGKKISGKFRCVN